MTAVTIRKTSFVSLLIFAAVAPSIFASVPLPAPVASVNSNLGVIKGIVRDQAGGPIADATVAIFRVGTSKLLKQVRSASDGSFLARIIPGTYTVLAVAEGFNPITVSEIEVGRASQLNYGFKLERAGGGNTLPEKRLDRNNPKWAIRAAQVGRSIYQNVEGTTPPDAVANNVEVTLDTEADAVPEEKGSRDSQTVVETYFAAGSDGGFYTGVNAATLLPLADNAEVIIAGQTGIGKRAPQRLETQFKVRPNDLHQVNVTGSFANLGSFGFENGEKTLPQISFQATDEWKVREGVILVFGVDYSRFVGSGDDFAISPRLGLQFDIDSKTRFRTAYTTNTENRTWSKAVELENAQVLFREPVAMQDIVIDNGKPLMNKSRRFEFGIERVLDNKSSVEANVFFDTTLSRGVGLAKMPFDTLDTARFQEITANQQGGARGLRLVYHRRINGKFSAAAGYSFGMGQKLSGEGISKPAEMFQNDVFQTFFGQFEADLRTGTSVKTVFRLSPQATVFAIDPFQGRLAIYDPSLSILVTQNLPTLGLPFHAEAVVDARNLFGFTTGVAGDESSLRLTSQRRALRGGILVRF
ncbi:MAG: TonB-dependent receptor [Acidobacteria bacterium]|nr:TonB-dependent receptor [Acidobacteriota bacterium]